MREIPLFACLACVGSAWQIPISTEHGQQSLHQKHQQALQVNPLSPLQVLASFLHAFNPTVTLKPALPGIGQVRGHKRSPIEYTHTTELARLQGHKIELARLQGITMSDLGAKLDTEGVQSDNLDSAQVRRYVLTITAHSGAAIFAGLQTLEDVSVVGHAHGMLLLIASRACRGVRRLARASGQVGRLIDEIEKKGEATENTFQKQVSRFVFKPLVYLSLQLSKKRVAGAVAAGALAAASLEVWRDAMPGGHHGVVALAMNELFLLLETSGLVKGRALKLLQNQFVRLGVTAAATLFALVETFSPPLSKLGAHHSVLVLAFLDAVKCIVLMRKQLQDAKGNKTEQG